jgi:ribosomal protein L37AE/L43A
MMTENDVVEYPPCYDCGGYFVVRAAVVDGFYKKFWICTKCGKKVKDVDLSETLKTGLIEVENLEELENEVNKNANLSELD